MKPILLAVLVTSAATGCATEEPVGYGDGLGTSESPIPGDGSYAVVSRIDVSLELPAITQAIANVRAFALHPARALLAQDGGAALISAVPTTLRNQLEGYIDIEIDKAKVATKTLRQYATDVASISENVLSTFVVESKLTITPTSVVHSFFDLNFTPANLDIVVPIGGLRADTLIQKTTATVGAGGAITFGEQRFGLAFGSHAWQAINLASDTLYGVDLTALSSGVNCAAVAQVVAAKCVSGTCVGHASQIEAICRSGLEALVEDLRGEIAPVTIDVLRFAGGNARLVDDSGDGIADRIVEGTWDAETDAGHGVREASGTFSALGAAPELD